MNPAGNQAQDPIAKDELQALGLKVAAGVVVVAALLAVMGALHALTIDNVITLLTLVALAVPIAYFILMLRSHKVSATERSRVWAYVPLFIAAVIFWAIEEQGSVVLAVFAADQTQLNFCWFKILPGWFQMLNPLFILIYGPIFAWLWVKLGTKQPSSPRKFAYGWSSPARLTSCWCCRSCCLAPRRASARCGCC